MRGSVRNFAALLLLLCLVCGYAHAQDDPVVVSAGGVSYRLSEAQAYLDALAAQYQADITSRESALLLRDQAVQSLVDQAILNAKYRELGLDVLDGTERESLYRQTEEAYNEGIQAYAEQLVSQYGSDAGEAATMAESLLKMQGVTVDALFEQVLEKRKDYRLLECVAGDVTVSDAEIEAAYEEYYVKPCREAYEYDISRYETQTMLSGEASYYMPTGYRLIRHILLALPADMADTMDDCRARLSAAQKTAGEGLTALTRLTADEKAAADAVSEAQRALDAANDAYYAILEEYTSLTARALETVGDTTAEILQRLSAGETFDALVAAYSTDPDMPAEGYPVHRESVRWADTFRDAAMALKNIGDVSAPIVTDGGVHILYYAADLPSGAAQMPADVRDTLAEQLLQRARYAKLETLLASWRTEYDIFTDASLLTLPTIQP